jgi:hypothetical protein
MTTDGLLERKTAADELPDSQVAAAGTLIFVVTGVFSPLPGLRGLPEPIMSEEMFHD